MDNSFHALPYVSSTASMEAAWFRHFESLGLAPERITEPVIVNEKNYHPHFWLENWRCYVYVANDRAAWDAADRITQVEAEELMNVLQQYDVMITLGIPDTQTRHNILLCSYPLTKWFKERNRSSLAQIGWSVAGLFDVRSNEGCLWILYSDPRGDAYMPNSQMWSPICRCNEDECFECEDFRVFYPVVGIELVNTDPTVGKEPQRKNPRALGKRRRPI